MDARREVEIPGVARKLGQAVEYHRLALWDSPPDDPIDRVDPIRIARYFLKAVLALPEELPPASGERAVGHFPFRAGSCVDRALNQISVARSLSEPAFRFTLAHAIGLWELQPRERYLRCPPRVAGDRKLVGPMTPDQEANLFAEELLMPADLVRSDFQRIRLEGTLRDQKPDAALAAWLTFGVERTVTISELILNGRDHLALLVAECIPCGEPGLSLAQRFRVSPLAMSIRLQRLELV